MKELVETTWWLEWCAPEDWHWARLQIFDSGESQILDCDGNYHSFNNKKDAKYWLSEDEYSKYEDLIEYGAILSTVMPPSANNEVEMIALIQLLAKQG
jgi:hypothetical protein